MMVAASVAPVTFDLSTDIDALALAEDIFEQQKKNVGVTYTYCGCGTAVSRTAAWNAKQRGSLPTCRFCWNRARRGKKTSKDQTVYLCSQCRSPLPLDRVRQARCHGLAATCGNDACVRAARHERGIKAGLAKTRNAPPPLPCSVCGRPSERISSNRARSRRKKGIHHSAFCAAHRRRPGQHLKNSLPSSDAQLSALARGREKRHANISAKKGAT